ncbi:glycosyltransferase [Candidatus Bathyarchaeota archaeon]|nr:MAG: glycosyltransferase [Candidatus Bathyarchaeota archaeon]
MRKVAGITPVWNEEACVVFALASLLPYVDFYVLVDSGSTDQTLPLVRHFFDKEIESGKLVILEHDLPKGFDISIPKNAAINVIREAGYDYMIRLDGDDVFYADGAKKTVELVQEIPSDITKYTVNHWELYQYKAKTTLDFLDAITQDLFGSNKTPDDPNFMCLRIPPAFDSRPETYPKRYEGAYGHARIYRVDGAVSKGRWHEETFGNPGDDIYYDREKVIGAGGYSDWIVHYGWARPLDKKMEKAKVWVGEGKEEEDIRVNRIHKEWVYLKKYNLDNQDYGDHCWPHKIIFPFDAHPEVVYARAGEVAEFLRTQ